ncbi:hypothetical protein [Snuella sedimenti]|uniref:Uncharacterized protein n=1 Tax=Snuella sedimenti TaxID=2798802 RepID=A0A8J7IZ12_9FLAO|nr:hypothetical protein [Snuella sedimenti]MBJ6369275.1 hypothetical protein [Snuella sedimenti]
MSEQLENDIYSLVWMTSPYKIGVDSFVFFIWSLDTSLWWLDTGKLEAGVSPKSGGSIAASLSSNNSTTFNIEDGTPKFSNTVSGMPSDKFLIMGGSDIPNSAFSTGTGESYFPTFTKQAYINTQQTFDSDATLWVAVTTSYIQAMDVLGQSNISNAAIVTFPLNRYNLTAVLGEDNTWNVF